MTAFPSLSSPFGLRRLLSVNLRQTMRGDLVIEREWRNRRIQHAYEIPLPVLTAANKATLLAFFAICRGSYLGDIAFVDLWDTLTYTCRLDQDDISLALQLPHWSGSLRLVEVANWKSLKAPVATFPATVPFQPSTSAGLRYRTEKTMQEDGAELRYEDFGDATGIANWIAGGDALTDDQAGDLLDCWEGNGGPYHEFAFTDPATSTVYDHCHFTETTIIHTLVTTGAGGFVHALRAPFEELKQPA